MAKRITATDIARRLGVSQPVVSAALSGNTRGSVRVSPEKARQIVAAARALGYLPNAAAKSVATGRFGAVGLVMSRRGPQSSLFGETLRGIHDGLEARHVHLTINYLDDRKLTSEKDLPKILSEAMVDGLLLNYTHDIPPRMVELIERHRLPATWVNVRRAHNCVHPDDEGAGHAAARRLLAAGHTRIAYLDLTAGLEDTADWHYSRLDRRAGYERAMREAGHEPLAVVPTEHLTYAQPVERARRLLRARHRPTAIVAYCRDDAQAVILAGDALGLSLGRDVSLVMIEQDQPLMGPKIDTLRLPEYAVGRAAAEMLLARLDDPATDQPTRAMEMTYMPGETVASVTPD